MNGKAAEGLGKTLDYESAREKVYGRPYSQWKELHQTKATSGTG